LEIINIKEGDMSKIKISVVVILAMLLSYSCSTMQTNVKTTVKIESDLIHQNGVRKIVTEPVEMEIGDAIYDFSMELNSRARSRKYFLGVGSTWKIQKNDILLLKLTNNETVKLTASLVLVEKVNIPKDVTILGGKQTGLSINRKIDYYSALFDIDANVLDRIKEQGIIKMRIEYKDTFFEQNWWSNELGKYITESRKTIDEQSKRPNSATTPIEDGF
jgi:hypothetical protein